MTARTDGLAVALGRALQQRGWRAATAESCTGGLVAGAITEVAGSSAWFDRGFVTYTNAAKHDQLILIHTPHLQDKHKGTSIIVDILKNDRRIKPERVLIDHCEEHTIRLAKDAGHWCGLTIYPVSKVTPQRGADILEQFGPKMIYVNSASDWG